MVRAKRGVIVTGGGTGIGRALARGYAEEHEVLVVGRTESTLRETAAGYDGIHVLAADITDPGAAELVVKTAQRVLGRVDILVNNAATAAPAPLAHIDRAAAENEVAVNLLAPLFLTQAALDALAETRGVVLNMSSSGASGGRAWPGFSGYGATKVAVEFLTRTWSIELAPRGIRVVAIAAGVVASGMGVRMGSTPEQYSAFLADIAGRTPAGRVGQPEELAWWARQLTAPEAEFATGSVVVVDGGLSLL
ncbi:SDR family NAD(P)-dependent oxidoreductase [Nocardia pseudobrasiliensis]|uniref:C-7 ketoreductase n=1 Tax=Nocardia pseudobrasiliensis TaxID=45979 RepID=A0A370HW39_9NOCA|nr:SDR family oxidoreductase [Nocardia pseudobrasiliensis]RDI62717.1 C-7 ketoreductase [Nocardia pseudobrasiliensis]